MKNTVNNEQIDDLLSALDSIAREYDMYDYGLPGDEENVAKLRQAVTEWLEKLTEGS